MILQSSSVGIPTGMAMFKRLASNRIPGRLAGSLPRRVNRLSTRRNFSIDTSEA